MTAKSRVACFFHERNRGYSYFNSILRVSYFNGILRVSQLRKLRRRTSKVTIEEQQPRMCEGNPFCKLEQAKKPTNGRMTYKYQWSGKQQGSASSETTASSDDGDAEVVR